MSRSFELNVLDEISLRVLMAGELSGLNLPQTADVGTLLVTSKRLMRY